MKTVPRTYFSSLVCCMVFTFVAPVVQSQTTAINRLKKVLHATTPPADRLQLLLALCDQHQSMDRDTLYSYAVETKQLAYQANNRRAIGLAELAMANAYKQWGWVDSLLAAIDAGLVKCTLEDPVTRQVSLKLSWQKGLAYGIHNNLEQGLKELYPALANAERYKDTLMTGYISNSIGSLSIARGQLREALRWILAAANAPMKDPVYKSVQGAAYINAANVYAQMGRTDSAEYYINRSLLVSREMENLNYLATALRVQSGLLAKVKRLTEAEAALKEMISIRRTLNGGNNSIFSDDNLQLADFYANSGQLDKAIALCKENLKRGEVYGEYDHPEVMSNDPKVRLSYYEALARYYKMANNDKLYQETLEELIAAKDTMYAANSAEAIADVETKYEVQKKENTIIQQKLDLTKKNYWLFGSVIFSIMAAIIVYLLFNNYRRKEKIKLQKAVDEEKRLSAQAVTDAEEQERKRISADLHDSLGAYAASIASNLDHLHLNEPDTPTKMALEELKNNSRAVVSELSDTIWALKKDSLFLTAISDRLKMFVKRVQPGYPEIRIDIHENIIHDHLLSPSHAFHLLKILQEGINNALRHSNCKNIWINIDSVQYWVITIADDGRGMPQEITGRQGDGLTNMRNRTTDAGWRLQWLPREAGGTIVEIKAMIPATGRD